MRFKLRSPKTTKSSALQQAVKVIVHDYGWIHLSIGVMGNAAFFIGSILFLPQLEPYKVIGVWLFIGGSLGMLIGAIGQFFVSMFSQQP
jgi:hypothetical protein